MKMLLLFMLTALITLAADASSVLWDLVSIGESEHQEFRVLRNDERPFFWSVFDFDVVILGNRATLTSNPGGDRILSYAGAWLIAYCGDIVNSDTTLHCSSYFEYGLLGNGEGREDPISVEVGEVNYLKIVLQDGEQCFDYQDGARTVMPDCYYGWVAYSVDSKGKVSVLSSALDVMGSSLIVGGGVIPEPSSGLLLLLSCAMLALRRKRI